MAMELLDHVNIRANDLSGTLAFYRDVLGMGITAPPGAKSTERGAWIIDKAGNPVIHVSSSDVRFLTTFAPSGPAESGSGAVHHVALNCSDYDGMKSRLSDLDQLFELNDVPMVQLRQIFVKDPNGILLELNFRGQ